MILLCYSLFYEDWAFLRDEEKCAVLPTMAAGTFLINNSISGVYSVYD